MDPTAMPTLRGPWGHPALLALLLVAVTPRPAPAQVLPLQPLPVADEQRRTDVRGVLTDSLRLLVLEHTTRVAVQDKTRRELGGRFWSNYRRSVRVPKQWEDGDGWLVNYVGHPGHGAAAGFIWIGHDSKSPADDAAFDRRYFASRLRASGWSAAYSLQFEFGPLSEASLGNVGRNPSTGGWVDHVVTPAGGFVVMVAEDALDRYVVSRLEQRVGNALMHRLMRTALNPSRAIANVAAVRPPWHRPSRPIAVRSVSSSSEK
jgi:hypothetical protein